MGIPDEDVITTDDYIREYTCAICFELVIDAHISAQRKCEHLFCGSCIEEWCQKQQASNCPVCREEIPRFERLKGALAAILDGVRVRCPNKTDCEWTGNYSARAAHIGECKFEVVLCENEGCEVRCRRDQAAEHTISCLFSKTDCPHCNAKLKISDVESHAEECPDMVVPCPRGCGLQMARRMTWQHDKTCPDCPVQCSIPNCDLTIARKSLSTHIAAEHLVTVVSDVAALQKQNQKLTFQVHMLQDQLAVQGLLASCATTWVMPKNGGPLVAHKEVRSKPFFLYGYRLYLSVCPKGPEGTSDSASVVLNFEGPQDNVLAEAMSVAGLQIILHNRRDLRAPVTRLPRYTCRSGEHVEVFAGVGTQNFVATSVLLDFAVEEQALFSVGWER